jgi:hypothetical protein
MNGVRPMKSPTCKDCEFRHAYCHANCEIYQEWAKEKSEETRYTREQKMALSDMWSYGGFKK